MENSEIITVLEGAKTAILTYGWIQHSFGCPEDGFCSEGAVGYTLVQLTKAMGFVDWRKSIHSFWDTEIVLDELTRSLQSEYETMGVIGYNDEDGRTKEDILDLMDKTIKRLLDESVV